MIRVLCVLTDTNIGGAGRVLIQLIRYIDRDRFEILCALPEGSALIPLIEAEGITVKKTRFGHDRSFDMRSVFELYGLIRRTAPDIVHTGASLSGRLAAFLCGTKGRIHTRHCVFAVPRVMTLFPIKQLCGAANGILSTEIIAVADAAADNLADMGVRSNRISVILNGVEPIPCMGAAEKADFRRRHGIGEDDFAVLISARLEPCKGHSYIVEAARILSERQGATSRHIRFIFMGDGSERARLAEQCRRLCVEDDVIFTGFIGDVAPWYNISDAVLNASWGTEATSLSICEAMSLGKPIVATRFGGNTGIITDGVNGLLIPTRNSMAAVDALTRLCEDEMLYRRLSDGAKEAYEKKLTCITMAENTMRLYEKSLRRA